MACELSICSAGNFYEIDFLPKPFEVFQYYPYGVRRALVAQKIKHAALVLDFGGGTFDVSIIETTARGDISQSGRNSKPLSAASTPVGGYYLNRTIAQRLMKCMSDKNKQFSLLEKAFQKFAEETAPLFEELCRMREEDQKRSFLSGITLLGLGVLHKK